MFSYTAVLREVLNYRALRYRTYGANPLGYAVLSYGRIIFSGSTMFRLIRHPQRRYSDCIVL